MVNSSRTQTGITIIGMPGRSTGTINYNYVSCKQQSKDDLFHDFLFKFNLQYNLKHDITGILEA